MTIDSKAKHARLFAEGRDIARVFYQGSAGGDTPLRPRHATIAKLARFKRQWVVEFGRC